MDRLFGFIIHPMELGLIWLVVAVGGAGIGIILFTILVRLVLSPLQIVQLRNAKAMQRLQPQLAELKKKHGKDRTKLSEETMALYKEHQVNPAMGCLPTLLQFPILIGLFYALLHLGSSPTGYTSGGWSHVNWAKAGCNGLAIHTKAQWLQHCYAIPSAAANPARVFDLFHANFLWLSNGLGAADPFYILPILAGVTQWIQSRMLLTKSADPQQQMMNTMTNFFPLMIVFFALRYPSGLSLYWVTSTLIGILVQYRITGLGLLRNPAGGFALPGLSSLLGPPPAPRQSPRKPKQGPKPAVSNPPENSDGEQPTNGSDGVGKSPPGMTTVARPRKKANRARGGKSGGRRG